MYQITRNGKRYPCDDIPTVREAILAAKTLLAGVPLGQEVTYSVENKDGYLIAVATNRRIHCDFYKQRWDGSKRGLAEVCHILFDVTDHVLLMDIRDLHKLRDGEESSAQIGRAYVSWDGPCRAEVVDSVCAYFGVNSPTDITPDALAAARALVSPQPPREQEVTMVLKVKVRVASRLVTRNVGTALESTITSTVPGITVSNVKTLSCE